MKYELQKENCIDKCFKWKDRHGNFHKIKDMSTDHLFHTFMMIWNHSVDDELKFKPYKKYKFGKFYTIDYIKIAAKNIIFELIQRTDLKPKHINNLSKIKNYINNFDSIIMINYFK